MRVVPCVRRRSAGLYRRSRRRYGVNECNGDFSRTKRLWVIPPATAIALCRKIASFLRCTRRGRNKKPGGEFPQPGQTGTNLLSGQAAADRAGDAYQPGSEKTQCAGLRNLGRRVAARDSKTSAGTAIITHDADVKSEAGDLTNIRIENGEGQGGRKLLTVTQGSFEEVAERKRPDAGIRLQAGAHIADAETRQRTTC